MTSTLSSIDLVDATARATVLLLLASCAVPMLRRSSAALRHRVWALALCGTIALPVASWLVPGWRLPVLPASAPTAPALRSVSMTPAAPSMSLRPAPAPTRAIAEPKAFFRRPEAPPAPARIEPPSLPSREPSVSWPIALGWPAIWAFGAIVALLPTVFGLLGNVRLRRGSRPVTDPRWLELCDSIRRTLAIRRRVELREGVGSTIPMTWGILRPVVLLPADAGDWPVERRRLVLLHELAHVRRFDAGLLLLGRLSASTYWFHPLAWYALRRLRIECEHACDDIVVAEGECPTDYAGQLVALAKAARAPRFASTIAMARAHLLERRLSAMFDETTSHRPLDRRAGRRLLAVAAAVIVGLAMIHPGPSDAPAASALLPTTTADEPPAKGTGRIDGRVVRDDGEAVADAEVVLLDPQPKNPNVYYWPLSLRRTKTGADGRFAFAELTPGKYRVWANRGNLTSRPRSLRGENVDIPESGPSPKPVELRLHRAVRVTVTVLEKSSGRPIPGSTIRPGWSDFIDDFRTGPDGRVAAEPFTAQRWQINVFAEGFAKEPRWLNLANGEDAEAEFRLVPGGDVEGVVRDASGKPVPGASVGANLEDQTEQFDYVHADGSGRYRIRHLPLNVGIRVHYSKDGGDYLHETAATRLTGPRQTLDLALRRRPHGGSIAGVVRDGQGRPIAGALLRNPSNSSAEVREAKTGPDGRFVLDDLYESVYGKEVIVTTKGFSPKRLKVEPGPAGKLAEVDINLEPGHRIEGLVTDDRGRPIKGVRVYYGGAYHGHEGGGRADTDDRGRFAFDSLPDKCTFALVKEGYSEIDDRALPLDRGEAVTVAMVPAGVVAGRVLDGRTGKPIRSFKVQVGHSARRRPEDPSGGIMTSLMDPGQTFQSDEGRFRIGELILGMPLQVSVSAEGYERAIVERVIAARPDEVAFEDFRLDRIDPASFRTYRGRLRDFQGKPVAGAQVRLFAARNRDPDHRVDFPFNWSMIHNGQLAQQPDVVRFLSTSTDAKGIFRFDGVPVGTEVEVAWWGKGIPNGRADHLENFGENKEGWFDLTLPAPSRIVGTVDRKAYPSGALIRLGGSLALTDHSSIPLKPDQTEFAIDDLPPGEYSVLLTTAFEPIPGKPNAIRNDTLARVSVKLEAGETASADFKP